MKCRLSDVAGRPEDEIFKMLFFLEGGSALRVTLRKHGCRFTAGSKFALIAMSGCRLVVLVYSEVYSIC